MSEIRRIRRRALAVLALAGCLFPAAGHAQDLPAETDRLLWCSSAFYWLASNAYDSGANTEAKRYENWSKALMDKAIPTLRGSGKSDDDIQTLVQNYDDKVLDQLGAPDAPYEVTTCPELVPQPKPRSN